MRVDHTAPDELPHGVPVQAGELPVAAPGHQDDGLGGGGHQAGAADVLLQTVGDQADDLIPVGGGEAGVVEEDNTAVLQVMLPPLHWKVAKYLAKSVISAQEIYAAMYIKT